MFRAVVNLTQRLCGRRSDPAEATVEPLPVVEPLDEAARQSWAPRWLAAFRTQVFAGLAATGLFLFGGLTILVTGGATAATDLIVTHTVQSQVPAWLGSVLIGVSALGFPPLSNVLVAVIVGLFFLAGRRLEAGFLLGASASVFLTESIKAVIGRPRPATDLVNVLAGAGGMSFPSGHTLFYVTFFGFLAYIAYALWKPGWFRTTVLTVCTGLILLVGPSRIWMGQHWFSDVLASYALGMTYLWLLVQLYSRLRLDPAPPKLKQIAEPTAT
jgi:membrane-associated phospholipid phosphatase